MCLQLFASFSFFLNYYYFLFQKGSANQYRGIVDCVQTIVREEGPPALLKVCSEASFISRRMKYDSHVSHCRLEKLNNYAKCCALYFQFVFLQFSCKLSVMFLREMKFIGKSCALFIKNHVCTLTRPH